MIKIDKSWTHENRNQTKICFIDIKLQSPSGDLDIFNWTVPTNISIKRYIYVGLIPSAIYRIGFKSRENDGLHYYTWFKYFVAKPYRPKGLSNEMCSELCVKTKWSDRNYNFFRYYMIRHYLAQIEPNDSPKSNQTVSHLKATVFDGLKLGKTYTISVTALAERIDYWLWLDSDPSQLTITTRPTPPAKDWCNLNTLGQFSFDIKWDLPELGSGFDGFIVKKNNKLLRNVTKDETNTLKFYKNINPGNSYQIEVSTIFSNKITSLRGQSLSRL